MYPCILGQIVFSDLTRTKCRWGCASDLKMSTAPQQERSDTHKVTRGCGEHMVDFHPGMCKPRNMNIETFKSDVLACKSCDCDEKRHPTEGPATRNQGSFTKRRIPAFVSTVQVHQTLHLPQKATSESTSDFEPWPAKILSSVQKMPGLLHGWKSVRCHVLHLPRKATSQMSHACNEKTTQLRNPIRTSFLEEGSPAHRFARDFIRKVEEIFCCKGHQICRTRQREPWIGPKPYLPPQKKTQGWPRCLGKRILSLQVSSIWTHFRTPGWCHTQFGIFCSGAWTGKLATRK